ncbi:LOW QUALITY PROTEIN: hypothetical protein CXG81DRAFT_30144 [Caulochytrium protostelioides]|uniref:PCI domain-containing protein n=1 Tax=Caulochytrium protostelioides TaxID=1555241 RepID=A0A4P9X3V4_9FUNG|nr:LOW QUALITY PROTEIN: hypothetical protein CXG81DRAFT_30144 [Caulochytrium protostelioides]|eukprot:RKO99701.1 LOW QUALITY PROTEIN: hypothetical protein CXG81DRAFT_30144 [Caulochytrium protostelioides]
MSQETIAPIPNLALAQHLFVLNQPTAAARHAAARAALLDGIRADAMDAFYAQITSDGRLAGPVDSALVDEMAAANAATLTRLEAQLADAQKNAGETEITDALLAKAEHLARTGHREKAVAAYRIAIDKTGPLGHRIDMTLALVRIGFFHGDHELITRSIEKARALIEEGGDWDRRNRLKVYEGLYRISVRDFRGAVDLLIDALATFTCTEVMPYREFVRYVVLTAALTLKRPDFKSKIVDAPEILEVLHEMPEIQEFANAFYKCHFFQALTHVEQHMKHDVWLAPHYAYYVREMRIIVYTQLLQSYRSLAISSMAASFGVSEPFIDADLARLIAAGRLNAVIDRVAGIVETNRPDAKNAQYQAAIKQGDVLLSRLQKLERVIAI